MKTRELLEHSGASHRSVLHPPARRRRRHGFLSSLSIIADIVLNNTDRRHPELPVHSIDASNAGSITYQHPQTPLSQRYALPSDGAHLANLPR
jgi:hypothetical protein